VVDNRSRSLVEVKGGVALCVCFPFVLSPLGSADKPFLALYQVSFLNDPNEFCETRPAASTTPRLRETGPKLEERRVTACIRMYLHGLALKCICLI
jgi:hypothetical protein